VIKKNLTDHILFSLYLEFYSSDLQNFGAYPHNDPIIMGDRHKSFEDPMNTTRDIRRTNYHLLGFYLITIYNTNNLYIYIKYHFIEANNVFRNIFILLYYTFKK
jgi:hypothetical protein